MKMRHVLGGLLAATIVAAPVAASAASDYTPYDGADEPGDAGTPSQPALDILGVKGVRGADTVKFTITYAGEPQIKRARYNVAVDAQDYRLLEVVYDANGTKRVNLFKNDSSIDRAQLAKGRLTLKKTSCPGASVTLVPGKSQLRFVLPVECFPGSDVSGGTFFYTTAGRWTPETFPGSRPSNPERTQPNREDDFADGWGWDGPTGSPSQSATS